MHTQIAPWYHHGIMWLVLGIPAVTVPAGLATVAIALRTADTVVADDVRMDGLAINQQPQRDAAARQLGISAALTAADGRLTVRLLTPASARPRSLVLLLSHGARASEDRMLTLEQSGPALYAATAPSLIAGHWYAELSPADRSWRLTGDFNGPLEQLTFVPTPEP